MGPARTSSTRRGVSRTVVLSSSSASSSRAFSNTRHVLNQTALARIREQAKDRHAQGLTGLAKDSRRVVAALRGDDAMEDDVGDVGPMAGGDDMDWENVPEDNNDDDLIIQEMRDITEYCGTRRSYIDHRTWRERQQRLWSRWDALLPELVDHFLRWRYPVSHGDGASEHSTTGDHDHDFTTATINIYTLMHDITISRSSTSTSVVLDLVAQGYLACTPDSPSYAVSFTTLELFHRIRLRKPSFSVEAFSKVICDLYGIPYRRSYRRLLADTFDIYLSILRMINKRIATVLGRDDPNWWVLNSCPPCTYELEGEPPLTFRRMFAADGNNSMKCMPPLGGRSAGDLRDFTDSTYRLLPSFVDRFAHETQGSTHDIDTGSNAQGDGPQVQTSCTDNFKAAQKDEHKAMWGTFEETGVFVSACRHGMILWYTDMIRSGELFKYPLSIVAKALETLGDRCLMGSDIGCKLSVTLGNSSLRDEFKRKEYRCCVNAFHGYAHNYACQLKNHPNVITGMGLEDLETLEHFFSFLNELAGVTRHASAYRRHAWIHVFLQQWDDEKYQNLGDMLYNNYRQALEIITNDSVAVADAMRSLGVTQEDLERWQVEQEEFFHTVGKEEEWDIHAMAYVELLQELRKIEAQRRDKTTSFLATTPADYLFTEPTAASRSNTQTYDANLSQTRKLETARRLAMERYNTVLQDVVEMEVRMGISSRWELTSPEYLACIKYMAERQYLLALEKLQRLVLLRLFELHKLNLGRAGYRVRSHIGKSLQSRCKAIRKAVEDYNAAALALNPPRPTLDWSQVSHYAFLEEFQLLGTTRQDIRDKPWAQPAIRETSKMLFRIKHAQEEITRCNVEIHRLHSAIVDEHTLFDATLKKLKEEQSSLLGPLEDYVSRRRHINIHVLRRIYQTHALTGFTGDPTPGRKKGCTTSSSSSATFDSTANLEQEVPRGDDHSDVGGSDGEEADIGGLVDYIVNLTIC